MKKALLIGTATLMVLAAVFMAMTGCENVNTGTVVLTVAPDGLTVTGLYAVAFSVVNSTNQTLYLPLRWSVGDDRLGTITSQGGLTALYQANPMPGVNTIHVLDQGEAEGFAVINQLPALGMEIVPVSTNLTGAGTTGLFTARANQDTDLVLPLRWSVRDTGLGTVIQSSGYTAVYESNGRAGYNIITAVDQMGASASALINQQ